MVLALKYWRVWVPIVLLLIAYTALTIWVDGERDKAVEARDVEISTATAEQVKIDEQIVYDAYVDSGVIVEYVDSVYSFPEPKAADSGDRLQRTEASAGIADRTAVDSDLGTSDELSIEEIDFIGKHADLLQ